jgi:PAS domain-containing protein
MEMSDEAEFYSLRKKAEEALKDKRPLLDSSRTENELLKAVHELEVFQIELLMQNEELKSAREKCEIIAQKYTSLYDFAPVSYLTLSREGIILDLNLIGSKLLGNHRSFLKKDNFARFISESERSTFNYFLAKTFESKAKEEIEIEVRRCDGTFISVLLTAMWSLKTRSAVWSPFRISPSER